MSHNLSRVKEPVIVGYAIQDPDGCIWLRPTRGSGEGAMSIWMTERNARDAAADKERKTYWYSGKPVPPSDELPRDWKVIKVRLTLKEYEEV